MEVIFGWVVLGLCVAAVLAGIRQIWQVSRAHAAAITESERRQVMWIREFEEVQSLSRAPLGSGKAERAGARVPDSGL